MSTSEDARRALQARALVENPLYAAYKADLEAQLEKRIDSLLSGQKDHVRMSRLVGEANALKFALGRPAELMKLGPEQTP